VNLVSPFDVDDGVPLEGDVVYTVRIMKNDKAPGPSGVSVEHLKEWLVISERDQDSNKWNKVIELIQHMFKTRDFSTELSWLVLLVISKASGGYRGIWLLEVAWKVVSAIIDARLKADIQLHDYLHWFRAEMGTVTATIEAKLPMQNACAQQNVLYQVTSKGTGSSFTKCSFK
jgi:hypothetical protein